MGTGYRQPFPGAAKIDGLVVVAPHRISREAYDVASMAPRARGAQHRAMQPEAMQSVKRTTRRQFSIFDLFYNRLFFLPQDVNFRAIAGDTKIPVTIWNAYLLNSTITSIGNNADQSITVTDIALPYTLAPLATVTFNVQALGVGQPEVNTSFDVGATVPATGSPGGGTRPVTIEKGIRVVGTRSKFLPYAWEARSTYSITYEFKAAISTSSDGTEQRSQLRQAPRRTLSYTVQPTRPGELVAMDRLLAGWRGKPFLLPELTKFAVAATGMPRTGTRMVLASVPSWLKPGIPVVLSDSWRLAQRSVKAIAGNEVQFNENDTVIWPAGTRVCPVLVGYMGEGTTGQLMNMNVGSFKIDFTVLPGKNVEDDPGVPGETFEGREVFPRYPSAESPVTVRYEAPADMVDNGVGIVTRFYPIEFHQRAIQALFTGRNAVEIDQLRAFWLRHRGSQKSFWYPSRMSDLAPLETITEGYDTIRVADTDLAALYGGDPVFQVMQIKTFDGEPDIVFRVKSIQPVSDDLGTGSLIRGDRPWPRTVRPYFNGQGYPIIAASWLFQARFANDTLTIDWLNDRYATMMMNVRTLKVLPVDNV